MTEPIPVAPMQWPWPMLSMMQPCYPSPMQMPFAFPRPAPRPRAAVPAANRQQPAAIQQRRSAIPPRQRSVAQPKVARNETVRPMSPSMHRLLFPDDPRYANSKKRGPIDEVVTPMSPEMHRLLFPDDPCYANSLMHSPPPSAPASSATPQQSKQRFGRGFAEKLRSKLPFRKGSRADKGKETALEAPATAPSPNDVSTPAAESHSRDMAAVSGAAEGQLEEAAKPEAVLKKPEKQKSGPSKHKSSRRARQSIVARKKTPEHSTVSPIQAVANRNEVTVRAK